MNKSNTSRALYVNIRKDGRKEKYNVKQDAVLPAEMLNEAHRDKILQRQLVANLLAGNEDKGIVKSFKSGKLPTLAPNWKKNPLQELRVCLEAKPANRRAAWEQCVENQKRSTGFSLHAIAVELKSPSAGNTAHFKERFLDACSDVSEDLWTLPEMIQLHELYVETKSKE